MCIIGEFAIAEGAAGCMKPEDIDVIFVFENGTYAASVPDVDDCVGNHAGIVTGTCASEWAYVVDIESSIEVLSNEPAFVRGENWASPVEFLYV